MNGATDYYDTFGKGRRDRPLTGSAGSLAEFETRTWCTVKDLYVQLERLGKLSPKDVVEFSESFTVVVWEEYFGLNDHEEYEDLDEDEKEELEEWITDIYVRD